MANTTFSGPVRSENGFESITKNTTTGVITTNASYGKTITGGVEQVSVAGAVDVVNLVSEVTSGAGALALTLADGTTVGQMKIITMVVDGGGTATVTPDNFANGTSIALSDVNDTVCLVWANTIGWVLVSNSGATINP
jgi:hypothetical protein